MSLPKRVVTSNATGAVYRWGRTDFTGQFNPADYTQHPLDETATWVPGVPTYYHKVVGVILEEMTAPEKAAVDTERTEIERAKLKGAARIKLKVPALANLPVPPPERGYLVAVESIAGTPGFAVSTASKYIVFVSDGEYPP